MSSPTARPADGSSNPCHSYHAPLLELVSGNERRSILESRLLGGGEFIYLTASRVMNDKYEMEQAFEVVVMHFHTMDDVVTGNGTVHYTSEFLEQALQEYRTFGHEQSTDAQNAADAAVHAVNRAQSNRPGA